MTRINTNVSSLNAQKTLQRSTNQLQTALTRLSTGLRINLGKDDPAGLIASEVLRSDIVSTQKAISNSERANQMIATADSALGQVSSLLNDIRGLVTEAANTGAMSSDQIAANQLQVDSALEALNRIAQTTSFQGRRLLDGSLDFIQDATSVATVRDIQIDQANLGEAGAVAVNVNISQAATQAEIDATGFTAAANASTKLYFAASKQWTGFADANTKIDVRANELGTELSGVTFSLVATSSVAIGSETAVYDQYNHTVRVFINDGGPTSADNVVAAINRDVEQFTATNSSGGTQVIAVADAPGVTATTARDYLTFTAQNTGADYNDVSVEIVSGAASGASFDSTNRKITVTLASGELTLAGGGNLAATLDTALNGYFDVADGAGGGLGTVNRATADAQATASTGATGGNALAADLAIEIAGATGTEVFTFGAGTAVNQIANAINLVSDSLGVQALQSGGTLSLQSKGYGSANFVAVDVISEGSGGTFEQNLSALREEGSDIQARVNGVTANGSGNTLSINTATLDLSLTVTDGSDISFNFTISGGGALVQMGPDVVRNQQARLGIQSVNAARLGGASGRLYELASGNAAALATDPNKAAQIVDEAITKVTSLRGRLGAFQKTTLDTNIASLNDTLENLTQAESSIRDADFAVESSNLTRAQILVQSGTTVLSIANQNPQNVLALLR
ncbi:MAG: flagellin [Planctomycetota bacterium]